MVKHAARLFKMLISVRYFRWCVVTTHSALACVLVVREHRFWCVVFFLSPVLRIFLVVAGDAVLFNFISIGV